MYWLREYQTRAVEAIESAISDGVRAPVIQMATGGGKTVTLGEVARRRLAKGRILALAHREEIIEQLARTFGQHCGVPVGIEQAGQRSGSEPIVVASVGTVGRMRDGRSPRMQHLRPADFGTVMIDEAHHSVETNSTYRVPLQHLGYLNERRKRTGGGPVIVGCSATLRRSDGLSLKGVFDQVVANIDISWLVNNNHLCQFYGEQIPTELVLDDVPVVAGDFADRALEETVNTARRNDLAISYYDQHHRYRQFIAFTAGVRHSHEVAAGFRAAGIEAVAVDGSTPKRERARIVRMYREGRIRGLVNCGVFTEGTDLPMAACIILMRPTKSSLLFTQMAGRGLRHWSAAKQNSDESNPRWDGLPGLWNRKLDCVLIDMVDISLLHTLMHVPSLMGRNPIDNTQQASSRNAIDLSGIDTTFRRIPIARFERHDPLEIKPPGLSMPGQWLETDTGWHYEDDNYYISIAPDFMVSVVDRDLHINGGSNRDLLSAFQMVDRIVGGQDGGICRCSGLRESVG